MHDSSILPSSRRRVIAARLGEGHAVLANELAGEFGVSEDAIRRDLRALADEGLCQRVYGGALPLSPASGPMASRAVEDAGRKQALARRAIELVEKRQTLFLDSGSTNLQLAGLLPQDASLTVITNSVPIAAALMSRDGIATVVIGGSLNTLVGGCVDARSIAEMRRYRIDLCFLGACALSVRDGLAGFDLPDVDFKYALIENAASTALMVTTAKLETSAPYHIGAISELGAYVLEADAPQGIASALRRTGAKVLTADPAA